MPSSLVEYALVVCGSVRFARGEFGKWGRQGAGRQRAHGLSGRTVLAVLLLINVDTPVQLAVVGGTRGVCMHARGV